eukprot:6179113-Pleurochrysis_carterae.AAC.4
MMLNGGDGNGRMDESVHVKVIKLLLMLAMAIGLNMAMEMLIVKVLIVMTLMLKMVTSVTWSTFAALCASGSRKSVCGASRARQQHRTAGDVE